MGERAAIRTGETNLGNPIEAKTVENYPVMLREVLRDHLARIGTVNAGVEGRITILNPAK